MKIEYVFPFDLVPKGSRVLLYGGGECGKAFYRQNEKMQWCEVTAVIDRRKDRQNDFPVPVIQISMIPDSGNYDYIVAAVAGHVVREEIAGELLGAGIDRDKILYMQERICISRYDEPWIHNSLTSENLQIAFLSVDQALGNTIMNLKQYQALAALRFPCRIDVYSGSPETAEAVFFGQPLLRRIYSARMLEQRRNCYDLVIQAGYLLHIIAADRERIKKISPVLLEMTEKIYAAEAEYEGLHYGWPQHAALSKLAAVKGINAYTAGDISGAFGIMDCHADIIKNPYFAYRYMQLGLGKRYVTFHHGADENAGGVRQTKVWPEEYQEEFNIRFKKQYPDIRLVQVGAHEGEKIKGADCYLWGEHLETVKYILENALLHIDCEGGLVHLASQLGTKCVVFFGPTDIRFYGLKGNLNIAPGICGNCMGAFENWRTKCMIAEHPVCMYSIWPEHVIERIVKERVLETAE